MTKPEISIGVHLFLWQKGRVLMGMRRNVRFGSGDYCVPSGKLERNETVVEGLLREAQEECGITLAPDDIELAHTMHFRGTSDWLFLFFTGARWSGEIENREPDKCAGWEWIDPRALPENTVSYARRALTGISAGRRFSVFGWNEEG